MTLFVDHSTTYRYNGPVRLEPHTLRLRPRMSSLQRLLYFDLQITPIPAGTIEVLDQDGNLALRAWFHSNVETLSIRSCFRVELLQNNPFDFLLDDNVSRLPLWYAPPLNTALSPYRALAPIPESVRDFATDLAETANWELLPFLNALNQEIFQILYPVVRPEGAAWPAETTLRKRQGSCRDAAMLFCDAARALGIAARFVSGYECATAGHPDASMHAWAEVYLPGIGWRGYDPSRGLAVSNAHVAVAAAFDSSLAAPIAGLYNGRGSHMETSLRMDIEQSQVESGRCA